MRQISSMEHKRRPLRHGVYFVDKSLQCVSDLWIRLLVEANMRIAYLHKREDARSSIFHLAGRKQAAAHREDDAGAGPGPHTFQEVTAVPTAAPVFTDFRCFYFIVFV